MRCVIYARVSTKDQHAENQLRQLRAWCEQAGHTIVAEFIDHESGGKSATERQALGELLDRAHRREFDLVLVWALDRLSREGMVATVGYMQRLHSAGVGLHSYSEPMISTENELIRDILVAIVSCFARAERQRIVQRVNAGIERARENGTRSGAPIGRPSIDPDLIARIHAMREADPLIRPYAIGKAIGIDRKTVRKYLKDAPVSANGMVAIP